ncbi:MAG: GTPase HflX [Fidelibacterota bacterium]
MASPENVVLVGVVHPGMVRETVTEHLDELELLANTAGAQVVGRFVQKREKVDARYFVGKGKAMEIVEQAKALEAQTVIFDDELSPSQVRSFLKLASDLKVIDRTGLILDIFIKHARSREAKTQVELAHLQYLLPRLTRRWTHLERQMGGIGTRAGMGETQIEVDRRLIRDRIARLRRDLERIDRERKTQSKRRKEVFRVALAGYTNSGKSTLMNALTGSDVFVEDQLFATLDTTVRSLEMDSAHRVLLSDSVGFIRKLPHTLVASFQSTLKEVLDADLLLILLDGSSPHMEDHLQTVREVLMVIGAHKKESLIVVNKVDLIGDPAVIQAYQSRFPHAIFISALNHLRLDALQQAIVQVMDGSFRTATVVLDHASPRQISSVYDQVEVLESRYEKDGVHLKIRGSRATVERIKALSKDGL